MNTSFASWKDAWLLDTSATCRMIFRQDFFEELYEVMSHVIKHRTIVPYNPHQNGVVEQMNRDPFKYGPCNVVF